MEKLLSTLLIFFFCFSTTALSQYPGKINNSKRYEIMNSIIPDFQVNDDQLIINQSSPSISADGSDKFVITWTDYRNGAGDWDIYLQRYSSDGNVLGSNLKVNDDQGIRPQWDPSISADASGNFVVTWEDYRNINSDIYVQLYSSNGIALEFNFKVNDDTVNSGQIDPSISINSSGNFVVTWVDGRNGSADIYGQRYSSDGSALGTNFIVNDDQGVALQQFPSISMSDSGNFVITWTDFRFGISDIFAQRYSSDGSVLGTNFIVNEDQRGEQWYSSISTDGNGNFVITWQDKRNADWDIYARRFSSDGIALGMDFKVNNDQGNADQISSSISTDGSGNFVITWEDERNGDPDIYAQRYSNDGSTLGSNFSVTNTNEGEQQEPDVISWNGRIYNTWKDNRVEVSYYDIWANVLDWENPNAVGDEELSQVPSLFNLSQNYPNPFNPITTIKYQIPELSFVTLIVYDVLGSVIAKLVNEEKPIGSYVVEFNGNELTSGVYFYQLQTGSPSASTPKGQAGQSFIETKKMVLLR